MHSLGMPLTADGRPPGRYRKHLPEIWDGFVDFAEGRGGEQYLRLLPGDNPFTDWSHHDRYAHRRHFGRGRVERDREAAREIRALVSEAMLEARET